MALPEEGARAGADRTAMPEMARPIDALKSRRPFAAITRVVAARPRQAAWLGLSLAICVVLAVAGSNADLPLRAWLALFAVAILVARACTWIVSGDDRSDADEVPSPHSALPTQDGQPGAPNRDSQQGS